MKKFQIKFMRTYSEEDGKKFLMCARCTVGEYLGFPMHYELKDYPERRGVFVTITLNGLLRGCIGFPFPIYSLNEGIPMAALGAAFEDPRFPPLTPQEFPNVKFKVSILSEFQPLDYLDDFELGRDGLYVEYKGLTGLLLPEVAIEHK
jgi:AmmeMemoRadiSam system protein A